MALTSKSKNYTLYAWQDNNIRLKVTQGEGGIKLAQFTLVDDNGAIDLTTATQVLFNGEKRNGSGCSIECEITNSTQGVITVPVETGMTDIAGDLKGVIEVITPNGNIKFDGITLYVASSPDAIIEVSNAFSALVKALNKIALLTPEGTIPLDDELTDDGVNAVQGKVIKKALDKKANKTDTDIALSGKISNTKGSVKTGNIADGGVTLGKLAEEVKVLLGNGGDGNGMSAETLANLLKNYAKAEDLNNKENTENKVTEFASNFEDADNKKYPTITALIKYLKDYYYDLSDIDDMVESMHIDDEGNLRITLPSWNGEAGETLIIGKVQGADKNEIIVEVNETISERLADLTQLEPNFVNSIDECSDTSKVYVLPDGYIYAYMKSTGVLYTNLVDPSSEDWKLGYRINGSGVLVTTNANVLTTPYIPVKQGDILRVKGLNLFSEYISGYACTAIAYDENKAEIARIQPSINYADNSDYGVKEVFTYADGVYSYPILKLGNGTQQTNSENIAYIRIISVLSGTEDDVIITVNEEIKDSNTYSWKNTGHAFVPADYEDRIISLEQKAGENTSVKKWSGKKWACVGDSITEANAYTTKHYFDFIAEETGIATVNMGVGGSGYRKYSSNLAGNKAFYQRILNVPTDTDVVTIFGSGNDLRLSSTDTSYTVNMGEVTDTGTDTICGCINKTFDNLFSICPTVQVGVITSIPWMDYVPSDVSGENLMNEYNEKLIEICKRRSIPYLDLYHCSNLRPWDKNFKALAYTKDDVVNLNTGETRGVHPDETGHKIIAPRIRAFLESLVI